MAEPEELILEGAHFATRVARDLWRRHSPLPPAAVLPLARVRARLEAFVTALAGIPIVIAPMEPPAPPTWLSRLARGRLPVAPALCGTDGERIYLPPTLKVQGTEEATLATYRLLAVQQAVRVMRETAQVAAGIERADVREWFVFAEAVAVDGWMIAHTPGLLPALRDARREALACRASMPRGRSAAAVEREVQAWLAADPVRSPKSEVRNEVLPAAENSTTDHALRASGVPLHASADASLDWARARAQRYEDAGRYESIQPVAYWGTLVDPPVIHASQWHGQQDSDPNSERRRPKVAEMRRKPRVRQSTEGEDDQNAGMWMIRADEPQESVEDPFGLQRPADRADEADPDGLADSLSELPEARVVRTPGPAKEVLQSGEPLRRPAGSTPDSVPSHAGIAYPEWDYRAGAYRVPGAIVRERTPALGDAAWVGAALTRHARLVRRVRTRFERLRPRPVRLLRQIDGADIDLPAYVTAAADRLAGATPDGRLYVNVRPGRRELAVAILVDVSASTDAWISTNRRIVDVEKEAMLLVREALEALGDRYALFAFSGEGASDVTVLPLKAFQDRESVQIRRRIAALDSDRYTRLGAPIRHVTAALCREAAASRLLLLLSDGKPNDDDVYEGTYGVEDTRQAVAEARRQGVSVFCLTVDREAPGYAGRIFGPTGFAVLRKPEQLPAVVVEVLRHLIRV